MSRLLTICLLLACLALGQYVPFELALRVEGNGKGVISAYLEICVPDKVVDFQIYGEDGRVCPSALLRREGGRLQVYFNGQCGKKYKFRGYGEAGLHGKVAQKGGVLRQWKYYDGKPITQLLDFKSKWNGIKGSPSTMLVNNIHWGGNPVASTDKSLTIYRAWMKIDKAGLYTLQAAGTGSFFVCLNQTLLMSSTKNSSNVGQVRSQNIFKTRDLKPGTYLVEVYHANPGGLYCMSLGLIPHGEKAARILEAPYLLPAYPAKLLPHKGKMPFSWQHKATLELNGIQMRLVELSDGRRLFFYDNAPRKENGYTIKSSWDFLPYWMNDNDSKNLVKEALLVAEHETLSENALRFLSAAIVTWNIQGKDTLLYECAKKNNKISQKLLFEIYCKHYLDEQLSQEKYEDILAELSSFGNAAGAQGQLLKARILIDYLGKSVEGESVLKQIDRKRTPLKGEDALALDLLQGDLLLYTEGLEAASAYLKKLRPETSALRNEGYVLSMGRALQGTNIKDVESYTALAENANPSLHLSPELLAMRFRFMDSIKRPRYAKVLAERVLLLEPPSNIAAGTLLYLAYRSLAEKDEQKARAYCETLVKEYANTKEAITAQRLLRK